MSIADIAGTLRHINAKLGEVAEQGIDEGRPLRNQQFEGAIHHIGLTIPKKFAKRCSAPGEPNLFLMPVSLSLRLC